MWLFKWSFLLSSQPFFQFDFLRRGKVGENFLWLWSEDPAQEVAKFFLAHVQRLYLSSKTLWHFFRFLCCLFPSLVQFKNDKLSKPESWDWTSIPSVKQGCNKARACPHSSAGWYGPRFDQSYAALQWDIHVFGMDIAYVRNIGIISCFVLFPYLSLSHC